MTPREAILKAAEVMGSQFALATALNLKSQGSIATWLMRGQPPAHHVLAIEKLTGVSRHDLRPDIYPREEQAA